MGLLAFFVPSYIRHCYGLKNNTQQLPGLSVDIVSQVSGYGVGTNTVGHRNARHNLSRLWFTSYENHPDLHCHKPGYVDEHTLQLTVI